MSFPDSSATFQPTPEALELLADARNAAIIYISGRTSTLRPSAADEALALRRALSARSYLVARGVSPLKIMVNFASAADFVADNATAEGRRENQRVDIEVVYIPTY
nr:outer membrane protein [uncultured bacterium]